MVVSVKTPREPFVRHMASNTIYQENRDQKFHHPYQNQQQQLRYNSPGNYTKYRQNYQQQQTYNLPRSSTNYINEHYHQYDCPPTRGIYSYQSQVKNTGNPNFASKVSDKSMNVHHKNDAQESSYHGCCV